jgi:Flp pilus assembly protein TadD
MIKGRIAQLSNALEADPSNVEVLEEEAVSYAQLFEFEKAAGLLDKLVAMRPKDGEAWRLLGETTLLSQQPARSTIAYEKAAALIPNDLQILTGLADAYIANGQPGKAVDYLLALKAKRSTTQQEKPKPSSPVIPSLSSEMVGSNGDMEGASIAGPSDSDVKSSDLSAGTYVASPPNPAAAASSASSVDAAAIDLLIGKVYGSWRGHDNDALATYDALIKSYPEDFRAYLAKGLFLKERGRKADAERMFIQVRSEVSSDSNREKATISGSFKCLILVDEHDKQYFL